MPDRPKRACAHSGCPKLVDSGCCDEHKGSQRKAYDRFRGSPADRGYDKDWTRLRKEAIRVHGPLCIQCLREYGRAVPFDEMDHIIPISVDPSKRLDIDNLQPLCKSHHVLKTRREQR